MLRVILSSNLSRSCDRKPLGKHPHQSTTCLYWHLHLCQLHTMLHTYRISNEFSFHTMYYETSCVFYIPEPLARGYKTHNEFHNTSYGMKIHLRFFLSHELTRNEQITRWNRLFPRIGDGWRRGLLRFDNKFALCSVINTRRRSHFTKVEIKNTKKSMFWCNNKSKFAVWQLVYIHNVWYSSDTEKLRLACADLYVTCCHKI